MKSWDSFAYNNSMLTAQKILRISGNDKHVNLLEKISELMFI
jgi:hypothetical protein